MAKHKFKKGDPRPPGAGRAAGTPNKTTALLKDSIIQAAAIAGDMAAAHAKIKAKAEGKLTQEEIDSIPDGLTGYLAIQATINPQAFLPLLGKVLPLQIDGDGAILMVQLDGGLPMDLLPAEREQIMIEVKALPQITDGTKKAA